METFYRHIYNQGFEDGFKEGSKTGQEIDFKTELVQLLESIKGKGIGEKTKATILEEYRNRKEPKI